MKKPYVRISLEASAMKLRSAVTGRHMVGCDAGRIATVSGLPE